MEELRQLIQTTTTGAERLPSVDQFDDLRSAIEDLRRELTEVKAELKVYRNAAMILLPILLMHYLGTGG